MQQGQKKSIELIIVLSGYIFIGDYSGIYNLFPPLPIPVPFLASSLSLISLFSHPPHSSSPLCCVL